MVWESIEKEFAEAPLGDKRRGDRLLRVVGALARDPRLTFPEAMGDPGQLEGLYRFLNSDEVTLDGVLAPHLARTRERVASAEDVLVIHDTTAFKFNGDREGLGRLRLNAAKGFFLHASLAITPSREPLGLLAVETWTRTQPPRPKPNGKIPNTRAVRRDPKRESVRWERGVARCESGSSRERGPVHIMDREGDNFDLFAAMRAREARFVIRAAHNRRVAGESGKLRAALRHARWILKRTVAIARRNSDPIRAKIHPSRGEREAVLEISARQLELVRPTHHAPGAPETLLINVVLVTERRPPRGELPIEWMLFTSEPIDTEEQVAAIVDAYRARWIIEELFKALKSGCNFEKRQLESFAALKVALGVFLPIAVQLLALRSLSRTRPHERSTQLPPELLKVLQSVVRAPLGRWPTNAQISLAVASLGGHLPSNGPPGWLVLGRGYNRLLVLHEGWKARGDAGADVINR